MKLPKALLYSFAIFFSGSSPSPGPGRRDLASELAHLVAQALELGFRLLARLGFQRELPGSDPHNALSVFSILPSFAESDRIGHALGLDLLEARVVRGFEFLERSH
jgi:hypothetical protein